MLLVLQVVLFSVLTRGFELVTRRFELVTHGFELVTRGFELVTRRFELITRGFELVTRGFELVTRSSCFTFPLFRESFYFLIRLEISFPINLSFCGGEN